MPMIKVTMIATIAMI